MGLQTIELIPWICVATNARRNSAFPPHFPARIHQETCGKHGKARLKTKRLMAGLDCRTDPAPMATG